jgi:hypothetical protein
MILSSSLLHNTPRLYNNARDCARRVRLCSPVPPTDGYCAARARRKAGYRGLLAPREWVRTTDRTGNNRLLYQLSYRGMRDDDFARFQKEFNKIDNSRLATN